LAFGSSKDKLISFMSVEEDVGLIGLEAIQTDSRAFRARTILSREEPAHH
jgi:hypothetical protein